MPDEEEKWGPTISKHIWRTVPIPRGRHCPPGEETKAQREVSPYLRSPSKSAAHRTQDGPTVGPTQMLRESCPCASSPLPPTPGRAQDSWPHQHQLTRHSVQEGVEQDHSCVVEHGADLEGRGQSQGLLEGGQAHPAAPDLPLPPPAG